MRKLAIRNHPIVITPITTPEQKKKAIEDSIGPHRYLTCNIAFKNHVVTETPMRQALKKAAIRC